jgi:hypothetical protein
MLDASLLVQCGGKLICKFVLAGALPCLGPSQLNESSGTRYLLIYFSYKMLFTHSDEGLPRQCPRVKYFGSGERRRSRFWERDGRRRTHVHIPTVEDCYVLLAIQYMIIDVFTGSRHRRNCVYLIRCIFYLSCP